jgi:curved DNA-binding protein
MEFQDYYQTLGVPRTASQADIKKAYRKLAREHHPDRKPGDGAAEARFKQVNEANEVLSDPDKRKRYDQLGANWQAFDQAGGGDPFGPGGPFAGFGGAGNGGRFSGQQGNVRYEFHTGGDAAGFSDFFRMFFGGEAPDVDASRGAGRTRTRVAGADEVDIDELLAQMGVGTATGGRATGRRGSTGTSRPAPRPAAEAVAEIDLEEAFRGATRLVDIDGRRLEVKIPRGADNGTRVKLSGQGPAGVDLIVVVRVRPHPIFTRKGADLERELPVTLEEALLGGEVPVGTLKGRVLLRIPAETQTGRRFRLKGQGMPHLRGEGVGDLYARVRVVLPTNLSEEARAAARAFLDLIDQPDPRGEPKTASSRAH